MTAQALTLPVTRISVPALLLAAAGTAAVVSVGGALLDERTVVEQSVPATVTSTGTGTTDPTGAYVDSLIRATTRTSSRSTSGGDAPRGGARTRRQQGRPSADVHADPRGQRRRGSISSGA